MRLNRSNGVGGQPVFYYEWLGTDFQTLFEILRTDYSYFCDWFPDKWATCSGHILLLYGQLSAPNILY